MEICDLYEERKMMEIPSSLYLLSYYYYYCFCTHTKTPSASSSSTYKIQRTEKKHRSDFGSHAY